MKKTRLIPIISLLLLLFACSRMELVEDWANNYISTQIDHYFDINSLQLQLLKKSLSEDLKKTKAIIFPKLATKLQGISIDVEGHTIFNLEKIKSYKADFKKIFDEGLVIFEPSAQNFVNQLSYSQVESFQKEFYKRTKELESQTSDTLEAKGKRYDKIKKQLEDWLGPLYPEQKKDIETFCNTNPFPIKEQVYNRNKLSREFVDSFSNKEKRTKFVHQLFYDYESLRESTYAKAIEQDQRNYFELISVILNKMSFEQKKYLLGSLKARINQIKKEINNKKIELF